MARSLLRKLLLLLCVGVPAVAISEEGSVGGERTFKDWALHCDSGEGCVLEHRVFLQGRPDAPILTMAFQGGEVDRGILGLIRVPIDVLLTAGLTLSVDGAEVRDFAYHHCRPEGCIVIFTLDTELRARLQRGMQAKVTVELLDGRRPAIPLTLLGVTAGLRALDEAIRQLGKSRHHPRPQIR